MGERFRDRIDAGRRLATALSGYAHRPDVVVLGLPRGGIPVAREVARLLSAPLGVFVVRKLGVPGHEELAMGAVAPGGVTVFNQDVLVGARVTRQELDEVKRREVAEVERRIRLYQGDLPPPDVAGQTVIVVDDGLATGSTMKAAVLALRELDPARIVVAVPVGAPETCRSLAELADEVVCALAPHSFYAVGAWYDDFTQTTDEEIQALLRQP